MTQHGAYERWSEVIVYFRWLHLFCRECQLEIKKANRQWFFYSFCCCCSAGTPGEEEKGESKENQQKVSHCSI